MYVDADKALKKVERVIGKSKKHKETRSALEKQDEELSQLQIQNEVQLLACACSCPHTCTRLPFVHDFVTSSTAHTMRHRSDLSFGSFLYWQCVALFKSLQARNHDLPTTVTTHYT
jgi:hypothetical protein